MSKTINSWGSLVGILVVLCEQKVKGPTSSAHMGQCGQNELGNYKVMGLDPLFSDIQGIPMAHC